MNAEKDLPFLKPWVYILTGFIFALLAAGVIILVSRQPVGTSIAILPTRTPAPIVIQVSGAVNSPGVYTLPNGSRVETAVQIAGGLSTSADASQINQASPLSDGQMVYIPSQGEEVSAASKSQTIVNSSVISNGQPININTAGVEELDQLPGIGSTKAQAIVDYRVKNGLFTRIEDLMDVPGIGSGIFEQIKSLITVQ